MDKTLIATITLARNPAEERVLVQALGQLRGYSVIAADGGSRPRFIEALHQLGVQIVCPGRTGLVRQVKASLQAALDASDVPGILYTEPDKAPFFGEPLARFLHESRQLGSLPLCFAARDGASFATFPEGQQRTERFINESTSLICKSQADYCYGPILLSRAAATLALEAPEDLGWGWRFWLLGQALARKWKHAAVPLDVPCPVGQRDENSEKDQIYRIKQAQQNLTGLFLGFGK
jgi:hypothetical protein